MPVRKTCVGCNRRKDVHTHIHWHGDDRETGEGVGGTLDLCFECSMAAWLVLKGRGQRIMVGADSVSMFEGWMEGVD